MKPLFLTRDRYYSAFHLYHINAVRRDISLPMTTSLFSLFSTSRLCLQKTSLICRIWNLHLWYLFTVFASYEINKNAFTCYTALHTDLQWEQLFIHNGHVYYKFVHFEGCVCLCVCACVWFAIFCSFLYSVTLVFRASSGRNKTALYCYYESFLWIHFCFYLQTLLVPLVSMEKNWGTCISIK